MEGCMFIAMYKHAQTQLNTSDRAKSGPFRLNFLQENFAPYIIRIKKNLDLAYTIISHLEELSLYGHFIMKLLSQVDFLSLNNA